MMMMMTNVRMREVSLWEVCRMTHDIIKFISINMMQLRGVGKWKIASSDINSECETTQLNGLSSHATINYEHSISVLTFSVCF